MLPIEEMVFINPKSAVLISEKRHYLQNDVRKQSKLHCKVRLKPGDLGTHARLKK